eukprot:jgi/Antlo1/323/1646
MSHIEKLVVRGVRSFNPSVANIVEFHPPLTIIVGQNGSGKTTIIEALKYATTGNMPPNTKGGAFIYDPKLAREAETKAQIKLKFYNTRGQLMVCTRSLQLTQKKSKVEQKTLESVLWTLNEQGEQVSISGRCAEIDKEVPYHLGVSPAILDNVVFCHQEESTWPLSEPGVVKKKMDEIFESTKYTRALQALKVLKRDQHVELRLKRQALIFLAQQKSKKEALEARIQETEKQATCVADRISHLDMELEKLCAEQGRLGSEKEDLEARAGEAARTQAEIRGLSLYVSGFNWPVLSREEMQELEEADRDALHRRVLKLRTTADLHQRELDTRVQERDVHMSLQDTRRALELQLSENKSRLDKLLADCSLRLANYRQFVERHCGLIEIDVPSDVCDGDVLQVNDISRSFGVLRDAAEAVLRAIESRAGEAAKERLRHEEALRRHVAQRSKVDVELEYLQRHTDKHSEDVAPSKAEIIACEREIARKQGYLESIRNLAREMCAGESERSRVAEEMSALCTEYPHLQDVHGGLCVSALEADCKRTFEEVEDLCAEVCRAAGETGCAMVFFKERLRVHLERVRAVSEKHGLESGTKIVARTDVGELHKELEKLNTNIISSANAQVIYKNLQKLGIKNNSCPVCKKPFFGSEKSLFVGKLEEVIDAIPQILSELEHKKETVEKKIREAERANAARDEKNAEVRRLNEYLDEMRPLVPSTSTEEMLVAAAEPRAAHCDAHQNLAVKAKRLCKMLKGMALVNAARANQLHDAVADGHAESHASLLSTEIDVLQTRLDGLRRTGAQKENSQNAQQPAETGERLRALEAEGEQADALAQQCGEKARLASEREQRLRTQLEEAWRENFVISSSISAASDEIESARARDRELRDALALKEKMTSVPDARCIEVLRQRAQESWDCYHREREAANDLEMRLKTLDENRKLVEVRDKLCELEKRYDGTVFERLDRTRASCGDLDARRQAAQSRRAALAGEKVQLDRQRAQLAQELKTAFGDCDAKYSRTFAEVKTMEAVLCDVDAGIGAIDKSIVEFHSRKLDEINTVLRDLWTTTYRGNDIDYIEIQADTSDTRSYNYRVCMVKNGCELDMRSRSSAGQKVVASILIRLALAETFTGNCSFMALDEPTTNLDQENIESLAATLTSLIERKRESGFQLIVITHDEHFVRLLCTSCDMYYKLRRNARGDSVVEKQFI